MSRSTTPSIWHASLASRRASSVSSGAGNEVCCAEFRAYTNALKRFKLRKFGDITPQRLQEMMSHMMGNYSPIVTRETAGRARRHQRLTPEWQALCAQASRLDGRMFEPPWVYRILESEESDGAATITLVCREWGTTAAVPAL